MVLIYRWYFLYLNSWWGKLKTFLENHFYSNIRFTHELSTASIPFLDLRVKLLQGKLETDCHIKPSDIHQCLHYYSSHSWHTKQSIVYSQNLRLARVWSHEADFRKHTTEIKWWFLKRGYPNNVIEKEMKKVKLSKTSSTRQNKTIPLDTIIGSNISSYLKKYEPNYQQKFTPSLYGSRNQESSARKLSSYLVRAKLYPLERKVGSFKCKG